MTLTTWREFTSQRLRSPSASTGLLSYGRRALPECAYPGLVLIVLSPAPIAVCDYTSGQMHSRTRYLSIEAHGEVLSHDN
jgi:hypothetical protein